MSVSLLLTQGAQYSLRESQFGVMQKKNTRRDGALLWFSAVASVLAFLALTQQGLRAAAFPLHQTTSGQSDTDVGAAVATEIQLSLEEGVNENGRRTFVRNSSIDFGSVSFVRPELISNGDSYLEDGHLMLEAVFAVSVVFNGASSVSLDLSKLRMSPNPFLKTYYSTSISRTHALTEIMEDPLKNNLNRVAQSTSQTLRMVFKISPQQQGSLTDRFRIEASSL